MFYFPMAGLSSRFIAAGYSKPKYYLEVGELSLFQASLGGFKNYFESDSFCFIYLKEFINEEIIRAWAEAIGLPRSNCIPVPLSEPTMGQAETVKLAMDALHGSTNNSEEAIIFNVDTIYHDFKKPKEGVVDFLDVTKLEGSHWSFIVPDDTQDHLVRRVVEKERVSDLCSVGLYGFRSSLSFSHYYTRLYGEEHNQKEEYVAPIYQEIIDDGGLVSYREFPQRKFNFLGTPEEYEHYVSTKIEPHNIGSCL